MMTLKPSAPLDAFRRATARRLRQKETLAERRLWNGLRRLPLVGSHSRRQVPIRPYVVDIACLAARLVIEVDGPSHSHEPRRQRDDVRSRWLEAEGYRILRFWNAEVAENLDGVLDTIYAAVHGAIGAEPEPLRHARHPKESPTPPRHASRADPPPPGEGGEPARKRRDA
jgi:very-short-patch-repair endonuclease